tara:strand:+ start:1559 stop:1693 length:135 start_codon:yes stop_codon:yes gene_type:complete
MPKLGNKKFSYGPKGLAKFKAAKDELEKKKKKTKKKTKSKKTYA